MTFSALAACASALTVTLAAGAGIARAAEISWGDLERTPGRAEIVLLGDIVPGDANALASVILVANENGRVAYSVNLYSRGGSLEEGLALGRVIRHYRLYTEGPLMASKEEDPIAVCSMSPGSFEPLTTSAENTDCACYSACALAWLGGMIRVGSVGFHRAYLGNKGATYADHESVVSGAALLVSEYLQEMRVPSFVFDRILTTDAPHLAFLAETESEQIRYDPVFKEFLIARCGPGPSDEDVDLAGRLFSKKHMENRELSDAEEFAFSKLNDAALGYGDCLLEAHFEASSQLQSIGVQ